MSSYKTILSDVSERHAHIVLNRPDVRNALNDEMISELKSVLSDIKSDNSIKTVSVTGAGSAFCSGADIGHMQKLQSNSYQENYQDSYNLAELFYALYQMPQPTIAIVNGPALAGGCGLATVCDFVIADPGAKFGYPEVKIGFVAAIVSGHLIRQVGERFARELLLSGRIIDAEQALEIGLINKICDKTEMHACKQKLINELHNNSQNAMKSTKELLAKFQYSPLEKDLHRLAEWNASVRKTEDFKEGISSFMEKRKPNWIIR